MDGLDDVRAGALAMAYIDAAADSRVHVFDELQDVERRLPELVFRAMVVDCDPDVVLLHELLYPRQSGGRGISGDDDGDTGPLAILKFGADVVVFIYREDLYGDKNQPAADSQGVAELIVGKQRNGPTGIVKLEFIREFTRFENLASGHA